MPQTWPMMTRILILLAFCATFVAGQNAPASAQSYDLVVQADVLPGWRAENGQHTAAIRISLNPGWKTYWRAPGDAGIPPTFVWRGSKNIRDIQIAWPTPDVMDQNGMRSIGYHDEVILPVTITPNDPSKPIRLKSRMDIGVCRDICVPQRLTVTGDLGAEQTKRDGRIAAALADRPYSEKEAKVKQVTCRISPAKDGLDVLVKVKMPSAGGEEVAVIETNDPRVWVAEAATSRNGGTLTARTQMVHVDGKGFMLDRSAMRITVLGTSHAVDIHGCEAG
nr:protein-disulfide reductase DsbD domain-containing protein [uncultured Shimia sp.]